MKFWSLVLFLGLWTLYHPSSPSPEPCLEFPYGHLCRSMDLTGFCMQVSHIMFIRENMSHSPPYTQFDQIFAQLEAIGGLQPFVHFGGYERAKIFPQCVTPRPPLKLLSDDQLKNMTEVDKGLMEQMNKPRMRPKCKDDEQPGAPDPLLNPGITPPGGNYSSYYNHTQEFIDKDDYEGCAEGCDCCVIPPSTKIANGTIFTIQDACELKYIKAPMFFGADYNFRRLKENEHFKTDALNRLTRMNDITKNGVVLKNPYKINVTEITVEGIRLHNWLHITITSEGTAGFSAPSPPCPTSPVAPTTPDDGPRQSTHLELGEGKIKMAFLQVNDATGLPVGEFVNSIPCNADCNCPEETCHQGTFEDTFPCMFDGRRVTTNTGMMMVYAKGNDGCGEGLNSIHGTWRFTQSQSPESFTTELQFWALVVDDLSPTNYQMRMSDRKTEPATPTPPPTPPPPGTTPAPPPPFDDNFRISSLSEMHTIKLGMFGWNPVFDIFHPTAFTIGAYDYFREDVFEPDTIKCHVPVDTKYYTIEPYPDSGIKAKQVEDKPNKHCYRLNIKDFVPENSTDVVKESNAYCSSTPPGPSATPEIFVKKCPGVAGSPNAFPHELMETYGLIHNGKVDKKQTYPWTLPGARIEAYVVRDGYDVNKWSNHRDRPEQYKLYFGSENLRPQIKYKQCEKEDKYYYGMAQHHVYPEASKKYQLKASSYGHSCRANFTGRRVLNLPLPIKKWPNVLATLWKLPHADSTSYEHDRCYCTELPERAEISKLKPNGLVLEGRRQHAIQMILAWNLIIPFAIFVSRYYKETYSKVFFLQEYWWYTIHVLCMISAAMFTFGGIYVIELKRKPKERGFKGWWDSLTYYWDDKATIAHMSIGIVIIVVFFAQSVSGFFRAKDPKRRKIQIMTHWLLGVLEYVLAVTCMFIASAMTFSSMSCVGVVALTILILIQVMFYASMEVHMRLIDKKLELKPKRGYLPPPLMRVFHKDAPEAKFRIWVLIGYLGLCLGTSSLQILALILNKENASCFQPGEEIDRGDGTA